MAVHRAFREVATVLEYEVVQEDIHRFAVRVVLDGSGEQARPADEVEKALRSRLGSETEVRVFPVPSIHRSAAGKVTPFRSLVGSAETDHGTAAAPPGAGATTTE